ncbi:hypothetical protein, partial [Haloarcula sp. Atlit-120R]|uniref:hypothetical protein n=1 Tax=Haloarcula sp. Atlit-120R TaxID=2282135 RepID=UPI000FF2FB25
MSTNNSSPSDSEQQRRDSAFAPGETTIERGEDLGLPDPVDADRSPHEEPSSAPEPRRDDWWGDPQVETVATEHHEVGTEWDETEIVSDKARHTTFQILRDVAPKLCGASLDDPAKTPVELSEPCARPHGEGNRVHLRAARVNKRDGCISGGESTGVRLGDVDDETFWNAIELLFGYWTTNAKVPFDETDVEDFMIDA